jgi:hypothetical protein
VPLAFAVELDRFALRSGIADRGSSEPRRAENLNMAN